MKKTGKGQNGRMPTVIAYVSAPERTLVKEHRDIESGSRRLDSLCMRWIIDGL